MNSMSARPVDAVMRFRLDGRTAFLSGATGLLGRPMAYALAKAGSHVILNARNQGALATLATEMKKKGLRVSVACFDITNEDELQKELGHVREEHGCLDILVNNASSGRTGSIETSTSEDFMQAWAVNVLGPFHLLQHFLGLLKAGAKRCPGGASVINIGSMYGSVSPDPSVYGSSGANNPPYYGAAKAGLLQLTRYAACHLAQDRIRVNCISPGPFPAQQFLERDPEFHGHLNSKVPMRRTGDTDEIQGPILFLASDASSYVTGINLPVDGGWTAW